MKNLFICLLLSISITSSYAAKIKVACIGNSITAGYALQNPSQDSYPSILQSLLGTTDYEVKNYGYSGTTMLKRFPEAFSLKSNYTSAQTYNPDILIIKLGTNDSSTDRWKYKAEFKQDYIDFVAPFKAKNPNMKLYLCYPMAIFNNDVRDKVVETEVIPLIDQVAAEVGATTIDLHTPLDGHSDCGTDNLHPNPKGTNILARVVYKALCPDKEVPSLPEKYFSKFSFSDFTQKAKNITTSLPEGTDLSVLTDKNVDTSIDVPFTADSWITFQMPALFTPTGYSIFVKNNEKKNNPSSWKLQASRDGVSNWTNLNEKTNQAFFDIDSKVFEISAAGPNLYFRLLIQTNNGGDNLHLADIQLYGHFSAPEKSLMNTAGGTVTAQYPGTNSDIDKIVDRKFDTKYSTNQYKSGWIQYELPVAAKVDRYTITSADNLDKNPISWNLLGSSDGNSWKTLDTRNNQDFMVKNSTMEFKVGTPGEYKFYRLKINDNNGNSTNFEIAEWQLFEAAAPSSIGELPTVNASVSIYPNPVKDEFSISCEQQPESVEILGADGKIIKSYAAKTINSYNVSNLPAGLYFVRIKTDKYYVVKFVK